MSFSNNNIKKERREWGPDLCVETGQRNHDDGGRWLKKEGQNSRQSPTQVKGGGIHCGGSNQYGNGVQSSIGANSKELQNQKNIFAELM